MALFYVLEKISILNYPAKFFWVNLMPFVNVNVASYLPCGSRLKNEVNLHVSLCLSSVFYNFHSLLLKFGVLAEHC